jgi:predicted homoserine dehydrogenase-like protein
MPAAKSLAAGALPIGLAHRVRLRNDIAHGVVVRWDDVEVNPIDDAVVTRRAMEARYGKETG